MLLLLFTVNKMGGNMIYPDVIAITILSMTGNSKPTIKYEVKKEVKKGIISEPVIEEVIESEIKTDFLELESAQKAIGSISEISQPLDKYYLIVASFFDNDLALDYAEKLILSESIVVIISPFSASKFTRVALQYETLDKAKIGLDNHKDEFAEQLWILKY